MSDMRRGFTLVEMLIVVLLLSIVAMIVVPRATTASEEARETALGVNLVGLRKAIELYKTDHRGRLPLDPAGSFGPYVLKWPANPYVPDAVAELVKCAAAAAPARDDSSGWYYSTETGIMHVNSAIGALTLDPS